MLTIMSGGLSTSRTSSGQIRCCLQGFAGKAEPLSLSQGESQASSARELHLAHPLPSRILGLAWILFLSLVISSTAQAAAPFTVVIDPGHGGHHEGAVSPSGVREKDVALAVAQRLARLLSGENRIRVVMTRNRDEHISLSQRVALANRVKGDLFLSIHCNSMPTHHSRRLAQGIETYLLSADASDSEAGALAERENAEDSDFIEQEWRDPLSLILDDLALNQAHEDSVPLGKIVHTRLIQHSQARDRGLRQAPFRVLSGITMPAVLVEMGFISHPEESRKLASPAYQQLLARALHEAVLEFQKTIFVHRASGSSEQPEAKASGKSPDDRKAAGGESAGFGG